MAKKADLEAAFRACSAGCTGAAHAESAGDHPTALGRAVSTLPLLRDSIAFLRRYRGVEAPLLPSVDLILRCAPPMFARKALDRVGAWLGEASRADRAAYPGLPAQLDAARRRLVLALRVWPT